MQKHFTFRTFASLLPAFCLLLASGDVLAATTPLKAKPVSTKIVENGKATLPIKISEKASPRVQAAANTLGEYLTRMSGAKFSYETAAAPFTKEDKGVLLGLPGDFEELTEKPGGDVTETEDYLLQSRGGSVWLVGGSELGLEHAVWDLLYQFGYRQFFPGDKWEIVPKTTSIHASVSKLEHPDYFARRIWPGFGTSKPNYAEWTAWCAKNRVATGIDLITGHAYNSIILRNQKEFDAHPEYYALVKDKRQVWNGGKFCISNPWLRKLVVEDSLRQFEQNPKLQSISLDPSDGGDWCECPACLAMGSVTDRVVTLTNEVAAAVNEKYPGKFIGIYAYNEHSPPPTIKVHPNVVVSIATAYIRGGYTVDQLLDGWSQQAQYFGIREYYSFYKWDWDIAGLPRVSNLDYLKKTTTHFYKRGARFMNSESSDNWGPNGLGYYLASRMLWNTAEADKLKEVRDDFLTKAFGAAREPMDRWYQLIDGANKPLITPDLVGRLYRELDSALKLTQDAAIRARLYDLALYTKYLDNAVARGERKPTTEQSLRFAWRIHPTHMVHSVAIWTVSAASLPPEAALNVPEEKNPWKSREPYTPQEIEGFIKEGLANNEIANFTPVAFSRDLVPATPLNLQSTVNGDFGFFRGEANVYTWAAQTPTTFSFEAKCGIASGAMDRQAVFTLFSKAEATGASSASAEVATDNKSTYPLTLSTKYPGLQSIVVNDTGTGTVFTWPANVPLTFESSMRWQHNFNGKWNLYFYVPKGTKVVGGYKADAVGLILGPDGKPKYDLSTGAARDYWSIPVGAGEDGKLWFIQNAAREVRLLTVPPYLARNAQELLLPKEIVEADRKK